MLTIKKLKENLDNAVYDEKLAYIYCRDKNNVGYFRNRLSYVADKYAEIFDKNLDSEIAIFSAPGRTEIGGNHTDHQRGKVLTGSVDLDALACAAPNNTTMVNIFSEGYGMISIDSTQLEPVKSEENTTKSLIRGILSKIASMGWHISGFDAYVISDVPGGSGLSSSACFEVLLGVTVNGLFCKNALGLAEIAKIGQYAENVFFGKPSGLLDQMGCAIGGIITIDFADKDHPIYHAVNFDFAKAGYALCIVDTGADHADLTADYATIPAEMREIASSMGKEVLCEVNEDEFYARIPELRKEHGDRAILRAIHYFSDCHRVEKQVKALENDDFDTFLRLVSSSGHSSYMYLQNVATYRNPKNQPVGVALAVAAHYLDNSGARRVHGGGFAGTIQAFVPLDKLDTFKNGMDALLGENACRVTYIRPVGGCTLVD